MKFIAHTVKNLEQIALSELQFKIKDFVLDEIDVKKVRFESTGLLKAIPNLYTLDDLSIYVLSFELQSDLVKDIINVLKDVELMFYRRILGELRELDTTFSITVSSFKNNNIDKELLKNEYAAYIKRTYKLKFTPLDHSNFDIRLTIEKKICNVYIKVLSRSLFFRDYRVKSLKGSIRPSIAGAMLSYLTKGKSNYNIVDNFCGSGTFLCEGLLTGNNISGGDISKESVAIAQENIGTINQAKVQNIKQLNAMKTKWSANYFDIAISNLPWNKQISISHITELYSEAIMEYGRILKPDASIALIGYKPDLMIKYLKKAFPDDKREIKTLKIGYLGQSPTIVFSTSQ